MAPSGYGNRVEGLHAVEAAAAAGRVLRLSVESRRRGRSEIEALIGLVGEERVSMVEDVRPRAETDAPQGLVAECRPIVPVPLDSMIGDGAAVMVLDHIEDPHNVGAIARSAAASGMTGMVVSARRAAPLSAAAFKAAAGALERLPVSVVGSIPEALSRLKNLGLWLVGLDSAGASELFDMDLLTEPVAVVIGAEGAGLSRLTAERCDLVVSIPMADESESLNASVSAALAGFEIMRVRRNRAQPG
ncbi:MAG TPA: RNA methyltransferase [Acidimicrobiia bacterium]